MKKLIAGIALMFCGVLLEGFVLIAGSTITGTINEWDNTLGKFWYGIDSNRLMFLAVSSLIVAAFGLVLTLVSAFSKKQQ